MKILKTARNYEGMINQQPQNTKKPINRKIIHVDMDAFYTSVEVKDNHELRGEPVIVGGSPNSRSVVAAASYEARKYGIFSAMSCAMAYKLCPHAIFINPRPNRYREISMQISDVFDAYSYVVEKVSLDEAWLDVTENPLNIKYATEIAKRIKREIFEKTELTCSVGVSYSKVFSKLASEEKKPNGLFVIKPDQAVEFLMPKDVRCIPGIGKATLKRMHNERIYLCSDLRERTREFLLDKFGKHGQFFYNIVRGYDKRIVAPDRADKSISVETTFPQDILWGKAMEDEIRTLSDSLQKRMDKRKLAGKTINVKIKFQNFQLITRSYSLPCYIFELNNHVNEISSFIRVTLLSDFPHKKIRLIGLGVSKLIDKEKVGDKYQPSLLESIINYG